MPKAQSKSSQSEEVRKIPVAEIHPFEGHPFRVVDDELMQQTVDSIMQFGVLSPAIVRPDPRGDAVSVYLITRPFEKNLFAEFI